MDLLATGSRATSPVSPSGSNEANEREFRNVIERKEEGGSPKGGNVRRIKATAVDNANATINGGMSAAIPITGNGGRDAHTPLASARGGQESADGSSAPDVSGSGNSGSSSAAAVIRPPTVDDDTAEVGLPVSPLAPPLPVPVVGSLDSEGFAYADALEHFSSGGEEDEVEDNEEEGDQDGAV